MKKLLLTILIGWLVTGSAWAAAGVSNIVAGAASVTADTNGLITWPAHPIVKNLDVQTNLLVSGTLTAHGAMIYGDAAQTNAIFISAAGETLSNAVGKVTIAGGSYGSTGNVTGLSFSINTNQLVVTNGLVGIGTAAPVSKLEVHQAVAAAPGLTEKGGLAVYTDNSGVALSMGGYTAASPYTMYIQAIDCYAGNAATYPLALNPIGGKVGIGTTTPGTNFVVNGEGWFTSLYVTNDVSCGTLTDHSDSPADAIEAARMIATFAAKNGQVDHEKLDPGLWGKKAVYTDTGITRTNIVEAIGGLEGEVIRPKTTNIVSVIQTTVVPDQSKRNLSMLVSAQALVIQDLIRRIEKLEGK